MTVESAPLVVAIHDLAVVRVVGIDYPVSADQSDFGDEIRAGFQRVYAWLRDQGYDPDALLTIGVIRTLDGRLAGYGCCVEAPGDLAVGSGPLRQHDLPGGRYAVVTIPKDPAVIAASIGRFHQEYMLTHDLELDPARPLYEVYFVETMDYCVPLLAPTGVS